MTEKTNERKSPGWAYFLLLILLGLAAFNAGSKFRREEVRLEGYEQGVIDGWNTRPDAEQGKDVRLANKVLLEQLDEAHANEQRCREALESCLDGESHCPSCGADLRTPKNCKNCEIDHLGGECYRDGKHKEDCLAKAALDKDRR